VAEATVSYPKERPTLTCDGCGGSGIVGEEHQLGLVEPLGCPDCQGTGDTGLFADAVLALLRFNGYRLFRPDDCETGIMDPVSGYIPVRYDRLWQVVDLKDNPTGKTIYALVPLAEEATQ